jgi:23S rRNA pseudouridine2604 synthase
MNLAMQGVRLAKRVAAEHGCSRSQAEALVLAGAVQVQGRVVTDPAHRVSDGVPVQVQPAVLAGPATVLLHKPADQTALQALRQGWPALGLGPAPSVGLEELWALPASACGLSVWSNERAVVRRVFDRERPLEVEWLLSMPLALQAQVIPALQAGGMRASLGHERAGVGQWRLVDKGDRGAMLVDFLDQGQARGAWSLRRQRLGRLGLAPLALGQARMRQDFEKF